MIRAEIDVSGVVQGVGFRPFVYRLAREAALTGTVSNTAAGVHIVAEGSESALAGFLAGLQSVPPLAVVHDLKIKKNPLSPADRHQDFTIARSVSNGGKTGPVTPDTDVCANCLRELFDPADRRSLYPFINCTDCGPRYTLIEETPYDRPLTSMKMFGMCRQCLEEYQDPGDRRFHAQATCCPDCGPVLTLTDNQGKALAENDPLARVVSLLQAGRIVAIKGLGGFHLAVDAGNEEAIDLLRKRKGRPDKPLAVMTADPRTIHGFADMDPEEETLLTDSRKPIVLLRKKNPFPLAANVAPGNRFIGVMLPYTPIHYLLFANRQCPTMIMTSGNLSGSPIAKANGEAVERLGRIADFFLMHDRPIVTRADDSVIRRSNGRTHIYRRARSYVPTAVQLHDDAGSTLALGAILKNTICLTRGREAFISQHIGNLDNCDTQGHQQEIIRHFTKLQRVTPDLLVHDLHPDYPSTRYALQQKDCRTIGVQHHHAHAVSCMAEHRITEPVIAITLDGSGYGPDNTIWGGEVLLAGCDDFTRMAHLQTVPMPGGEAAVREPWRMAVSHLYAAFGPDFSGLPLNLLRQHAKELATIITMMEKGINSPRTSSCGRLFDAVAALLDLRYSATYEGQAAAELEMCTDNSDRGNTAYPYAIAEGNAAFTLDTSPMIRALVNDVAENIPPGIISNRFHNSLAGLFTETSMKVRAASGINTVVLSGGVFQNMIMSRRLSELLAAQNFRVFSHILIPANDGGLSLGQAVAGRAMSRKL